MVGLSVLVIVLIFLGFGLFWMTKKKGLGLSLILAGVVLAFGITFSFLIQ